MSKRVSPAQWAKMSQTARAKLKASLAAPAARPRTAAAKKKAPARKSHAMSLVGGLASMMAPHGSMLSKGLGYAKQAYGLISGRGDYRLQQNSLISGGHIGRGGPPAFKSERSGTIVRHREYLMDITSSTGYAVTSFGLNPGLAYTFPWLAPIANNFEQWIPKGIVFEFVSTSAVSVGSTSTALGKVIMCTDYNPTDSSFGSSIEMQNYEGAVVGNPSQSLIHGVECAPHKNVLGEWFTRDGATALTSAQNQMFYDLGNFAIATSGMQAASNIGELWVSYEIELLKPKIVSGVGRSALSAAYTCVPTTSDYFASNAAVFDSIGLGLTSTTITFPAKLAAGEFFIYWDCVGNSTANVPPTVAFTSGCTVSTTSTFMASRSANGTSTLCTYAAAFYLTAGSAVITFSAGTLPVSATDGRLCITQVDRDAGLSGTWARIMRERAEGVAYKQQLALPAAEREKQVELKEEKQRFYDRENFLGERKTIKIEQEEEFMLTSPASGPVPTPAPSQQQRAAAAAPSAFRGTPKPRAQG